MTSRLSDDLRFTTPVIAGNATIRIVYEQESSAISPVDADNALRVNGVRGGVVVNGAAASTPCQVYQLDGKLVCEQLLDGRSTMIPLPTGQVYVVRVGSKTIKVMVE